MGGRFIKFWTKFHIGQTYYYEKRVSQTFFLIFYLNSESLNLDTFLHSQTLFWGGHAASCAGIFLEEEGGIQVLTGLAPSSQIVGSLFRILALRTWQKKISKKWIQWIHLNGKIRTATFHRTNLAKSKILETLLLPFLISTAVSQQNLLGQ